MTYKIVQEYLNTSVGTPGTLLIPQKIYDQIVPAVEKAQIGRQYAAHVFTPTDITGNAITVNLETADSLGVYRVGEGAAIPQATAAYTSVTLTPVKYATRPLITREMVEDSQFTLLQGNLQRAAIKLAENETALVTTALTGAANTITGGAAITIANITRAMQYLEDANYKAKVMFVGPEVAKDLRDIDTFTEANKYGNREMLESGFIGNIFGMAVVFVSGDLITSTSAYVVDPEQAYAIAEKRAITSREFDDAKSDELGVVLTQRLSVSLLRSSAVARITTT